MGLIIPSESRVDGFLSKAASIPTAFYREYPASPDLREYVACTWIRLVRFTTDTAIDCILPDGCADIMAYDDLAPTVAGPDSATRRISMRHGSTIFGIRLRPGACRSVFGCPADQMLNGSMLLGDLAPGSQALHCRLLLTGNASMRLALLEDWVRAALARASQTDRAVIAACRILGGDTRIPIGDVAAELDLHVRTIHRQFVAACGYGPKHFQRIMRIQKALRSAQHEVKHLSELAIAAGFSDQAHMTRDFRSITGFTPAEYFASGAAPGWGAWLDEER